MYLCTYLGEVAWLALVDSVSLDDAESFSFMMHSIVLIVITTGSLPDNKIMHCTGINIIIIVIVIKSARYQQIQISMNSNLSLCRVALELSRHNSMTFP